MLYTHFSIGQAVKIEGENVKCEGTVIAVTTEVVVRSNTGNKRSFELKDFYNNKLKASIRKKV